MKVSVMGIAEIAKRIGKTSEQVSTMQHRGKLPPPDSTVGAGRTKLWRTSTIERWIKEEQ